MVKLSARSIQYQPPSQLLAAFNVDFDLDCWRLAIDAVCTAADTRITVFERQSDAAFKTQILTRSLLAAGLSFTDHEPDHPTRVEIDGTIVPWRDTDFASIADEVARVARAVIRDA